MAVVMSETEEFFQREAKRCKDRAQRANKSDRKFWLLLAQRWEELLWIRERDAADAQQPAKTYTIRRTKFSRRHPAA
jgi:hypothetical protein